MAKLTVVEGGMESQIERCRKQYSALTEASQGEDAPHVVVVLDDEGGYICENVTDGEDGINVMKELVMMVAVFASKTIEEDEGIDAAAAFLAKLVANCL